MILSADFFFQINIKAREKAGLSWVQRGRVAIMVTGWSVPLSAYRFRVMFKESLQPFAPFCSISRDGFRLLLSASKFIIQNLIICCFNILSGHHFTALFPLSF
ncbi:Uncharacterized protein TCM_004675 [Theobroma cacao]|uniref:Uncharacterized protein n=1 Tax=Theobroma cacao TaxID=3641 RepID=A0A061DQN2_THECC|nr:Uncharacterized protein TCM_004675 [Theobroma cacao]